MIRQKNFKFIVLAVFLFGTVTFSFAQLSAGGKLGVNLANLSGSSVQNNSMLIGYNVGGFVNLSMEDYISSDFGEIFSIQAELSVQTKGTQADYFFIVPEDPTSTILTVENVPQNFTYVEVPVLAKFTFPTGRKSDLSVFAEAGPFVGALFGVTIDGKKSRDDDNDKQTDPRKFREEYSGYDFGVAAGAGLMYQLPFGGRTQPWSAIFNFRYSLGLSNIGEFKEKTIDMPESALEDIKTNAMGILLGIAYKF
ncbi:MAG: PorT family protein [Bacteroidetes bacterium]|nr:PorT family protein [Bacteroidota bacterium]